MYRDFFGFDVAPFEDRADPKFFFATPEGEETLASMEYGAHHNAGLAIILGEPGTGKTVLVRCFVQSLGTTDHVVVMTVPSGGSLDIVRQAAKGFGVSLPSSNTTVRCLSRLRRVLSKIARTGHRATLIIDQMENVTEEDLSKVASLCELEHEGGRLLHVILIGQPQLRDILNCESFGRMRQQAFGQQRTVEPLSAVQTHQYIHHRLEQAGDSQPDRFDEDAVVMIHAATRGNPRLINNICNAALVAAYGAGKKQITCAVMEEVSTLGAGMEPTTQADQEQLEDMAISFTGKRPASTSTPPETDRSDPATAVVTAREQGGNANGEASGMSIALLRRQEMVAKSLEGLLGEGEALAERLERALRKADRVTAAQEAGIVQSGHVEEHIESLTKDARGVIDSLNATVVTSNQALITMEERAREWAVQADAAVKSSENAIEQCRRVEQTSRQAMELESRLSGFAGQLADKMERAQEKITLLLTGLDAGEDVHTKLQVMAEQVSKLVADAEDRIGAQKALIKNVSDDVEKIRDRFTEPGVADFRRQVREACEELDEREKRITVLQVAKREVESSVRSELQMLQESAATGRQIIGELTQSTEHAAVVSADLKVADDRSRPLMEQVRDAYGKLESMQHGASATLVEIGGAMERVATLGDQTASCDAAAKKVQKSTVEGEAMFEKLHRQINESDKAKKGLEDWVSGLAEKVNQVADLARRLEEMEQHQNQFDKIAQKEVAALNERIEAARGNVRGVECELLQNEKKVDQLGGRLSAISTGSERTIEKSQEAAGIVEQRLAGSLNALKSKITELDASQQRVDEAIQTLDQLRSDTREISEQITNNRHEATQAREQIEAAIRDVWTLSSTTEAKKKDLSKLHDRSSEVLEQLTAVTGPAEELATQMISLFEQMRGESKSMQSDCQKAEDVVKRLSSIAQLLKSAEKKEANLVHTVEAAKNLQVTLDAANTDAGQKLDAFGKVTSDSSQFLEQNHAQLKSARSIMQELSNHRTEAQKIVEGLGALGASSKQLCVNLSDSTKEARIVIEPATNLVERMEARAEAIDSGQRSVEKFLAQADALTKHISDLAAQAGRIEQTVTASTTNASEIVNQARTQASKLEAVLTAVRKVSGALSKSTLESREKHETLHALSSQTADRLERLQGDTQRAVHTLSQWVQEAAHVQDRLARTIGEAPSITDTHPPDGLADLARSFESPEKFPAHRMDENLRLLGEPKTAAKSTVPPPPKPLTRAEEIAGMIEDARRAGAK